MTQNTAKCGCDCGHCPTFKTNLTTIEARKECSRGWREYLNIRLSPEKLRPCDGCQTTDEERLVYYLNCRVRRCARKNNAETCAHCSAFPCEDVLGIHSLQKSDALETIEKRIGRPVPREDYQRFIEPYLGISHLDKIHENLPAIDRVKMAAVSFKPRLAESPEIFPGTGGEKSAYRMIHQLISSLETGEDISYARMERLKKNRASLLKLLWAFARHGEWRDRDGRVLVLKSDLYLGQKLDSTLARARENIHRLAGYGFRCKIVPDMEKRWVTPGGALRREGWVMTLGAEEHMGGDQALKTMVKYAAALADRHGENAFRRFSRADMRGVV